MCDSRWNLALCSQPSPQVGSSSYGQQLVKKMDFAQLINYMAVDILERHYQTPSQQDIDKLQKVLNKHYKLFECKSSVANNEVYQYAEKGH